MSLFLNTKGANLNMIALAKTCIRVQTLVFREKRPHRIVIWHAMVFAVTVQRLNDLAIEFAPRFIRPTRILRQLQTSQLTAHLQCGKCFAYFCQVLRPPKLRPWQRATKSARPAPLPQHTKTNSGGIRGEGAAPTLGGKVLGCKHGGCRLKDSVPFLYPITRTACPRAASHAASSPVYLANHGFQGLDSCGSNSIFVLTNTIPVNRILVMNIEFDPAKDAANVQKHGVSLALAIELNWDTALTWFDARRTYGEPRQCALAVLGDRLYFVAFVDRGECRRIISLRKTNNREKLHYANTFDAS